MTKTSVFNILAIVVVFGIVGLVLAVIATAVYDAGYFVDALANMNITIEEVRVAVMVLCLIVGVVVGVMKS